MSMLIAYASVTGTAKECAMKLAQKLEGAVLCDLCHETPDIAAFDRVILGGSVRMGMVHSRVRKLLAKQGAVLQGKAYALFCTSTDAEHGREYLTRCAGGALVQGAKYADSLGGTMDITKQKGIFKWIVKKIAASGDARYTSIPGILQERVDALAAAMEDAQ